MRKGGLTLVNALDISKEEYSLHKSGDTWWPDTDVFSLMWWMQLAQKGTRGNNEHDQYNVAFLFLEILEILKLLYKMIWISLW